MIDREIRPITGERVINSFDFTDILTGKSYVAFYGGKAGSDLILRSYVFPSPLTYENYSSSNTYTADFDIDVNKGALVEGDVLIIAKYGDYTDGATINPTFSLIRTRNGVETVICTVNGGVEGAAPYVHTFSLAAARTKLNPGDKLTLRVSSVVVAVSESAFLYHDPESAADCLKIFVPFRTQD